MSDERHGMKTELTSDGVHPNLAGYNIMEPLVESAIMKALNVK
jgi:lysophospholipase L1-like esterase